MVRAAISLHQPKKYTVEGDDIYRISIAKQPVLFAIQINIYVYLYSDR